MQVDYFVKDSSKETKKNVKKSKNQIFFKKSRKVKKVDLNNQKMNPEIQDKISKVSLHHNRVSNVFYEFDRIELMNEFSHPVSVFLIPFQM